MYFSEFRVPPGVTNFPCTNPKCRKVRGNGPRPSHCRHAPKARSAHIHSGGAKRAVIASLLLQGGEKFNNAIPQQQRRRVGTNIPSHGALNYQYIKIDRRATESKPAKTKNKRAGRVKKNKTKCRKWPGAPVRVTADVAPRRTALRSSPHNRLPSPFTGVKPDAAGANARSRTEQMRVERGFSVVAASFVVMSFFYPPPGVHGGGEGGQPTEPNGRAAPSAPLPGTGRG